MGRPCADAAPGRPRHLLGCDGDGGDDRDRVAARDDGGVDYRANAVCPCEGRGPSPVGAILSRPEMGPRLRGDTAALLANPPSTPSLSAQAVFRFPPSPA